VCRQLPIMGYAVFVEWGTGQWLYNWTVKQECWFVVCWCYGRIVLVSVRELVEEMEVYDWEVSGS